MRIITYFIVFHVYLQIIYQTPLIMGIKLRNDPSTKLYGLKLSHFYSFTRSDTVYPGRTKLY